MNDKKHCFTFIPILLDLTMLRKITIFTISTFSLVVAGLKVPVSELVFKNQYWYYGDSNIPFSGSAFMVSKETGSVIQQTNYVDGLAWGKYYEWWPDGEQKVNGTYRYDLMFGRWKFFYENGKVASAGSYKNGLGHDPRKLLKKVPKEGINGLWTYWNEDGRKVEEGYYDINGNEKGNWAFWDLNGKKHLGKKISHETFKNENTLKQLNGIYIVANSFNDSLISYTAAHGSIKNGSLEGLWTFWNTNGNLASKQFYKNGSPNGMHTSYHPSTGKKIEYGLIVGYDDFGKIKRDGKWIIQDSTGLLLEEITYHNGKRHGLTTLFSPNGNQNAKIIYNESLPWNGKWSSWYANGNKKESGLYEEGEKKSPWTSWFPNGQKKCEINYQNNKKHGTYTEWNIEGKLIKEIGYVNGEPISEYLVSYQGEGYTEINKHNGKLSGSYMSWYSNGRKKEEGYYKEGKKNGNWDGWYLNGEKKYSAKFINGGATGIYTELDTDGRILKSIEYKNNGIISEYHVSRDISGIVEYHKIKGVLDGLWTRWYANGQKAEEGYYKDGKKHGEWNGWFLTKKVKYKSKYNNGKRSGTHTSWDDKGKKNQEIVYKNGKKISEFLITYDTIGGYTETNKKDGKLDGKWVKWYSKTEKEKEGKYSKGKKVGNWSTYSKNGTVIEEWNYDSQGRNLYEITYYDNGTVKKYCDYFSKTIQNYNSDGSVNGEKISF